MPYYHVYVEYIDKKGKETESLEYNLSKDDVEKNIATPYKMNSPFMVTGIGIHPSHTTRISIFVSEEDFEKLLLPDGTSLIGHTCREIFDYFLRKKVKGVSWVTGLFITSPPREEEPKETLPKSLGEKRQVFIVHGSDETQALRLQKYLTKLGIDAEMFEDFKERSSSNTIIEQLEYIKDNVGYAFVIVTPDDLGCLREDIDKCRTSMLIGHKSVTVKSVCEILDNLNSRARQNVVFEHGLFIGALGRDNVCCLLQKDTKEKPSDIDGILYVGFDKSVKETFPEITEKLKKTSLIKT